MGEFFEIIKFLPIHKEMFFFHERTKTDLPLSRNRPRGFFRWEDACGENDCIDEHRDMARTFEPGTIGEGTTLGEGNFPLHPFGGAKLRLLRRRGVEGFP